MTYACATSTRPNVVMAFDIQVIVDNCTIRRWPLLSVFGDLSSTCGSPCGPGYFEYLGKLGHGRSLGQAARACSWPSTVVFHPVCNYRGGLWSTQDSRRCYRVDLTLVAPRAIIPSHFPLSLTSTRSRSGSTPLAVVNALRCVLLDISSFHDNHCN